MKLFLQKNAKFSSGGGSVPRPLCLRRLGAKPGETKGGETWRNQWGSQAKAWQNQWGSGEAPRPPKQPAHCEFLATRLYMPNHLAKK